MVYPDLKVPMRHAIKPQSGGESQIALGLYRPSQVPLLEKSLQTESATSLDELLGISTLGSQNPSRISRRDPKDIGRKDVVSGGLDSQP